MYLEVYYTQFFQQIMLATAFPHYSIARFPNVHVWMYLIKNYRSVLFLDHPGLSSSKAKYVTFKKTPPLLGPVQPPSSGHWKPDR